MRKIVFDIETRNIFSDVGVNDPAALDISVLCLWDSETDSYHSFLQEDFAKLWPIIESADALIGYNSNHFDIPLLNKYYTGDLKNIKSVDLMATIKESLGRRLSLNNVAQASLGISKSADGLQAYNWWKEGKVDEIKEYCIQDVKVTKDLYEYMLKNKKIIYRDGPDTKEIAVDVSDWEKIDDASVTHTMGF
jgi:DEAD/DEAH box helicase domain-containing protein